MSLVACSQNQKNEHRDGDPVFKSGIFSWNEAAKYLGDIQNMGTRYIRIGGRQTLTDELWAKLLSAKLDVLYIADEVADRSTYKSDDDYIAAFRSFVDSVLGRYGPDGTYWKDHPEASLLPLEKISIRNEPNSYGSGTLDQRAMLYAKLLPAAYKHIKARWPSVTVVGFDASDSSSAAVGFISNVLKSNSDAAYSFDVMAIHPYTGGQAPDGTIEQHWGSWRVATDVHNLRALMSQYGVADKPIWFTEAGYQISKADGGRYDDSEIQTPSGRSTADTVSPELQAAYNVRIDLLAAAVGVPRIYHMFITDTDYYNGGYFQSVGAPRPVAVAIETMNRYLSDATEREIVEDGSANIFYYLFTTPRGRVGVAWATSPATYSAKLPEPGMEIIDLFGRSMGKAESTSYSLNLTESPTFLVRTDA